MATQPKPVRMEEIDWQTVLPGLVIFRSCRMAMQSDKMMLALAMVVLGYLGGVGLDAISGETTSAAAIRINTMTPDGYNTWQQMHPQYVDRQAGVFATAMEFKFESLGRMAHAAVRLDFGFGDIFVPRHKQRRNTVFAAMYDIAIVLPGWFIRRHPGLLSIYALWGMVLWAYLGGAIARLAALDVAGNEDAGIRVATSFAKSRFVSFLLTPILPGIAVGAAAVMLMAVGFLINWPGLNILLGAVFALMLLAGFVIAIILILLATSSTLFYPAIAVEDADSFDAINRAFSYVLVRPWRWFFYNVVALVYGAITYLVLAFIVFLSIAAVYYCMHFGATDKGAFNNILPPPQVDRLFYVFDWSSHQGTAAPAALFVWGWVSLMVSLLAAYVVSFGLSASTWVYLLLRQSADGNELNDIQMVDAPPDSPPDPLPDPAPVNSE